MLKMDPYRFGYMKKTLILYLVLVTSASVYAQKMMEKSWDATPLHTVQVESDAVFQLKVRTSLTKTIQLRTSVTGEHYENVVVRSTIVDGVLQITTGFRPFFKKNDDKLAAHKVISIVMELMVPEHKSIGVHSALTSVEGTGTYKNFNVNLSNGTCHLVSFSGNAHLKTRRGIIVVSAHEGTVGQGNSTYGNVQNDLRYGDGNHKVVAESIYGDIILKQTQ